MGVSTRVDAPNYLEGLSALAARGFDTIQAAVEAVLHLMVEQLEMRSSFLAQIQHAGDQLEVLASYNLPGGYYLQVGAAVPLAPSLSSILASAKRPSPLRLQQLQQPIGASLPIILPSPDIFSRVGCYLGVPIALKDGTFFGVLGAVDPEPQVVRPEQPSMLVVLARRLANEIEHGYELHERMRVQAELRKAFISLRQANQQLEAMNKMKSDFVATVSHEFRTTLTSIQGFSELMRDEDFGEQEIKSFSADISADAKRLSRLITDMLDLDRLESGRMTPHRDHVELNMLITSVVERFRPIAPRHAFHCELDTTIPALVGDNDKLIQVLTNLVSNAVKYSAGGAILLSSKLQGDTVHVQVQDDGIGIQPEHLEQVFERYSRIEAGANRYVKGSGLGLAIVRQIITMHGGNIWVESVVGQGSIFHFTLPVFHPGEKEIWPN